MSAPNPYLVPEGYFAEARATILANAGRIRRRRRAAWAGVCSAVATVALILGLYYHDKTENTYPESTYYEYDYFLQVFE